MNDQKVALPFAAATAAILAVLTMTAAAQPVAPGAYEDLVEILPRPTGNRLPYSPPVLPRGPWVTITNLRANQRLTNETFTVQGRAADDVGVSNVWYRLNGSPWSLAEGTAAWSAPVTLTAGTNLFQVYAEDAAQNRSLTAGVRCVFVVRSPLTLLTNGWGGIARVGFASNVLEVGRGYAVRAVPGAGQVFLGWDGALATTNNPLKFVMQSNMVLSANFIPNPLAPFRGEYSGLFYPADRWGDFTFSTDATNSGSVTLRVTEDGSLSGKLVLEGRTLPVHGAFDADLQARVVVPQPGKTPLLISLLASADPREDTVLYTVSGAVARGSEWTSRLMARRAASSSNALAGCYTLLVVGHPPGCKTATSANPQGDCVAHLTVGRTGVVEVAGTLGDGTPLSQTTSVSEDGYWPLFAPLYGGRGLLIAWMNFVRYDGYSMVLWQKPAGSAGRRYYPNGFLSLRNAQVVKYSPPPRGQNAVNWTNGLVAISGGNLPSPATNLFPALTNHIQLVNNRVRVLSGSISNLSLTITTNHGLFQGTFVHPVTGLTNRFRGAVMQTALDPLSVSMGGWFLGTNQSGIIRFYPHDPE